MGTREQLVLAEARRQLARQWKEAEDVDIESDGRWFTDEDGEKPSWGQHEWWEAFNIVFVENRTGIYRSEGGSDDDEGGGDDLLFFVRAGPSRTVVQEPFFVIRKTAQGLPKHLTPDGSEYARVDWCLSFQLLVVLHGSYQLTVAKCRPEDLTVLSDGGRLAEGGLCVRRRVYACASQTSVNLDASRTDSSQPSACYPDICFAVDNFAETFQDCVLDGQQHCYAVILHARAVPDCEQQRRRQQQPRAEEGGTAAASPDAEMGACGNAQASNTAAVRWLRVFAGFVEYGAILRKVDSCEGGGGLLAGLLWAASTAAAPPLHHITMRGPDKRSKAEVAVARLPTSPGAAPQESHQPSAKHSLLGWASHAAYSPISSLITGAASDASAAVSIRPSTACQLRCSLMTLMIPVEDLVKRIVRATDELWESPAPSLRSGSPIGEMVLTADHEFPTHLVDWTAGADTPAVSP